MLLVILYVSGIMMIIKNVGNFFEKLFRGICWMFVIIRLLIIIKIGVMVLLGISLINGSVNNDVKNNNFVMIDVRFVFLFVVIFVVFFIVDMVGFVLNRLYVIVEIVLVW